MDVNTIFKSQQVSFSSSFFFFFWGGRGGLRAWSLDRVISFVQKYNSKVGVSINVISGRNL